MEVFLQKRIDLAKALIESKDLPVHYADVALITCAVISACAAQRWPGRGIDKKRFLELLVRYSDVSLRMAWVSVPALLNASLISEDQTPYKNGHGSRIFRGDEIDLSFEDAHAAYPCLRTSQLRDHCYASIIYERLRCGYAHEYLSGEDIIEVPASRNTAQVSYIGRGPVMRRMIHFHFEYLIELAQHHVSKLPSDPQTPPTAWWSTMV